MSDATFTNPNSTITSYIVRQGEKVPSPELYLTNPNRNIIGKIADANNKNLTINFTTPNELTLSIPYQITVHNQLKRNKIVDSLREGFLIKLVFAGIETWYIISKREPNSDTQDWLNVQCYSLEYELTYKKIIGYKQTSYNCLQVLEDALKGTGWKIGYINDDFNLQFKQFDISSSTRLDFINQICTTFDAYAIYDTVNKKVNICKEEEVSQYKGFWVEYGKYLQNISQSIDNDEIYTRLHVTGQNNVAINSVNPTGQDYIDDFSYYLYPFDIDENGNIIEHSYYMSDDLCIALLNYNNLVDANATKFSELLTTRKQLQTDLMNLQTDLSTLQSNLHLILDNIQVAKDTNQPTKDLTSESQSKQSEINKKQNEIKNKEAQIAANDSDISALNTLLSFENNFTESQLDELTKYIHEDEFSDDSAINPEDLYEAGVKQLKKVSLPPINITLGIVNFFAILEEKHNWNRLSIGDIIRIKHDKLGIDVRATVNQLTFDFENNTIGITVSNVERPQTIQQKLSNGLYKIDKVNTDYNIRKRDWNSLLTNFNLRNDRIDVTPSDPILNSNPVSHKTNDNASINLTLTWSYKDYNVSKNDADNIDGFVIYMYSDTTNEPYTFGSQIAKETIVSVSYDKRAYTFPPLPPNRYYTLGIAAYRNVDNDINPDGVLFSNIVTPKYIVASENIYQAQNVPSNTNTVPIPIVSSDSNSQKVNNVSMKDIVSPLTVDNDIDSSASTIVQTSYLPSNTVELNGILNGIQYVTSYNEPTNPIVDKSVWIDINTKQVKIYTENGWEADTNYMSYVNQNVKEPIELELKNLQDKTEATIGDLQSDIDSFSSDGKITLAEANVLKSELNELYSESEALFTTADELLITDEKVAYQNALNTLKAELKKWIDQNNYPLDITPKDRTNITTYLATVQSTKSVLISKITAVRQAMSQDYTDQQVIELNGSLAGLGQEIDAFSSDNVITLAEANSLKIQLAQVQKESEDIIAIATSLNITNDKVNYQNALYDLNAELSKWIDQPVYPISITSTDRAFVKSKFESVQNYKSILINKIASVREANATAIGNAAQNTADKAWGKFSGVGNTLPAGEVYFGNGLVANDIEKATLNFNKNNDRISTPPANPIVASNGTAIDHTINTDGSANISFEWIFYNSGDAGNIDGFIIYVYQGFTNTPYSFGVSVSSEQVYYITADKRSFILYGVPANRYYTFGIQSYRLVDTDIASSGVLKSSIVKSIASGENPYLPSANVTFTGDITNSVIGGVTAVSVKNQAANALQKGVAYNNVSWGDYGFIATKSDNHSRAVMNATDGFKLQSSSDGTNWEDKFYADTNGIIHGIGLQLDGSSSLAGTATNTIISNINSAINTANSANSTATSAINQVDSKARTFTSTPYTPYKVGDIWKKGSSIYVCISSRLSGVFYSSDWAPAGDVTSQNTAYDVSYINGTSASTVKSNASYGASAYNLTNLWSGGTTTINGGYIQTGSIDVSALKANTVIAFDINGGTIWCDGNGGNGDHRFIYTNAIDTNPKTYGKHIYVRPKAGGEVRFTQTGTYDTNSIYVDARGSIGYFNAIDVNDQYNLYLRPSSGYEVIVTTSGSTTNYQDLRALGFKGNYLDVNINTSATHIYIRPRYNGEVKCTASGTTDTYVPIHASNVSTSSLAKYKQDIELWKDSALDIINNSDIYQYRLITDVQNGRSKIEYGLVIGDGYRTPTQVLNYERDAVEQYAMNSLSWKGIQELSQRDNVQQAQIDTLNEQNQNLILKVANLENRISMLEGVMNAS